MERARFESEGSRGYDDPAARLKLGEALQAANKAISIYRSAIKDAGGPDKYDFPKEMMHASEDAFYTRQDALLELERLKGGKLSLDKHMKSRRGKKGLKMSKEKTLSQSQLDRMMR